MGIAQTVLIEILRGNVSLSAIATAHDKTRAEVVMAVQRLKRRGLVEVLEPGVYAATEAGSAFAASGREVASGQAASKPRQRTRGLRQRAWWVIRAREVVTIPDLLSTLADGDERDAHANLAKYLKALHRTGFLVELSRTPGVAPTSNGHKRYRLARNTGRQAPVVRQRQREVFDPNTGASYAIFNGDDHEPGV